ncbi:MAG: UDP-N-acetylmuramoyl-L-alanyl-D-glutamate--2,6-diaminopimelate ligase, partial [Clostridia bacterium]|nr:UDP-N-acetylmuramoyl-L-alanyl-D-glutamate--2,6-diaminopimelate ligase [Clostridia bacterium]
AIEKGAVVVVSSKKLDVDVCQIIVDDVRIAMSIMAKNFYYKSDEKLKKVAIVGTNGKTTSSFILQNILSLAGYNVGVIGTNGVYINGEFLPSNLTTPDPIELHYIFSQMVAFNVDICVMEVSAHAIFYNKVYGLKFDCALFTNITEEHLDFFGTMEDYVATKTSFFVKENVRECVCNIDDKYGVLIAKKNSIPTISYGIYNPANIFAVDIKMSIKKSSFFVNINDEVVEIESILVGEYNIYNILGAIGVSKLLGVGTETIKKALKKQKEVAGRFNVFALKENKVIVVDFAHTPDGFEKVLSLIKKLRKGKIITIFGCVGYANTQKRVAMGEIAGKYSDEIIITTDNIGNADFNATSKEIVTKVRIDCKVKIIEDRLEAIKSAYKNMSKNDTLVILGKGAEKKQVIKGRDIDYCDIDVVKNLIKGECKC